MLSAGALLTGVGLASIAIPAPALADAGDPGHGAVGQIYRLQAAFHRAKSTQDIDLMMSLWDANGTLSVVGDPKSPYVGLDQLKAFWRSSGSFTHRRFSLVPSFKIRIDVRGDAAFLYFECHDVGDFDLSTRQIVSDTFLAGTLRRAGRESVIKRGATVVTPTRGRRTWVFLDMTAGKAFPLSVTRYYDRPSG